MTTNTTKPGALALKVFTDAIHHDEALKPEWRVPERLHADMVEALADLRALLEDRRTALARAEAAERSRDEQIGIVERWEKRYADACDHAEALAGVLDTLRITLDGWADGARIAALSAEQRGDDDEQVAQSNTRENYGKLVRIADAALSAWKGVAK